MEKALQRMREYLEKIRMPKVKAALSSHVAYSALFLLLGIALGVLSKWLDNLSVNDAVWWQHMIGVLDLRNVFSSVAVWLCIALAVSVFSRSPCKAAIHVLLFFVGVCVSYHLYTIAFSGFNPLSYMMIWYGFTLLSPILAVICWYGKGKTAVSLVIDILVLAVMLDTCFSVGIWYFDVHSVIEALLFTAVLIVLYSSPKQTFLSLLGAAVLVFGMKLVM